MKPPFELKDARDMGSDANIQTAGCSIKPSWPLSHLSVKPFSQTEKRGYVCSLVLLNGDTGTEGEKVIEFVDLVEFLTVPQVIVSLDILTDHSSEDILSEVLSREAQVTFEVEGKDLAITIRSDLIKQRAISVKVSKDLLSDCLIFE